MRANSDNKDGKRLTSVLDNEVTIFKACDKPNTKLQDIKLRDLLANIKDGAYSKQVQRARAIDKQTDLEAYKAYKAEQMMCFTLSGTFTKRKNISLVQHSGVMQIDFDDLGAELDNVKQKLIDDPYTLFCCVSPGGRGLKGGIVIDPTKHKESFTTARKYYKSKYGIELDKQVSAISNAFIVTHDPEIYINESAKQFEVDIPEPPREQPEKRVFADDPGAYAVKRIKKLINNIASASKGNRHGARLNNARTFGGLVAGGYCSKNDYWNEFISASDYVSDNGKTSPGELNTLEDGYNYGLQSPIRIEFKNDYIMYDNLNFDIVDINTGDVINEVTLPFCFWYEVKESNGYQIRIDIDDMLQYLKDQGFKRVKIKGYGETDYLVRNTNSVLKIANLTNIREHIGSVVEKLDYYVSPHCTRKQLITKILNGIDSFISQSKIEMKLRAENISLKRDTANESFKYFKNGIVRVSKNGVELLPYTDSTRNDGYIWESQILPYDFTYIPFPELENLNFKFNTFLTCVCSQRTYDEARQEYGIETDEKRLIALKILLGRLIHVYKDVSNKAIILTEANTDSNSSHGGTGKTLLMKAARLCVKVAWKDGKKFDPTDKFCFSDVEPDTAIVYVDDVSPKFKFDTVFSSVTGDFESERKFKDKQSISFEYAPIQVYSANHFIKGSDESSLRRRYDFEFMPFFSSKLRVEDYFNEKFLKDGNWGDNEWNIFYNFMFQFQMLYFSHDRKLQEYESATIKERALKSETSDVFIEFAKDIPVNVKLNFNEQFNSYKSCLSESEQAHLSSTKFGMMIAKYCASKGYKYDRQRRDQDFMLIAKTDSGV